MPHVYQYNELQVSKVQRDIKMSMTLRCAMIVVAVWSEIWTWNNITAVFCGLIIEHKGNNYAQTFWSRPVMKLNFSIWGCVSSFASAAVEWYALQADFYI